MAIVDIPNGVRVRIPTVRLTNNQEFAGLIKASDGETIVIELEKNLDGMLPARINEQCLLVWETDGHERRCPFIVRSKSPRAIIGQVAIQERRDGARIRVEMDLVYETVASDRVKDVAAEVLAHVNTVPEPVPGGIQLLRTGEDPLVQLREEVGALRDMLGEVMAKLDILTSIVVNGRRAETSGIKQPVSVQNCSSTGLGFVAREPHEEGEYLRLRMTLRTVPQTVIDCMGLVVRCRGLVGGGGDETSATHYDIGVHFTHIHESDREHLIHYIFKAQRRLLRDLKEARDQVAENS